MEHLLERTSLGMASNHDGAPQRAERPWPRHLHSHLNRRRLICLTSLSWLACRDDVSRPRDALYCRKCCRICFLRRRRAYTTSASAAMSYILKYGDVKLPAAVGFPALRSSVRCNAERGVLVDVPRLLCATTARRSGCHVAMCKGTLRTASPRAKRQRRSRSQCTSNLTFTVLFFSKLGAMGLAAWGRLAGRPRGAGK